MKTPKLLFSTIIVFFAINTYATIVYTDINPDGMPSGGGIDFNGDGINEFNMSSAFYVTYTWSAGGNNIWANGLPVGQGSGWDEPKPLAFNTVIDNSGNFIGCGDCAISGVSTNPFATMVNQNKYLGVRLKISGQTHYGWVQLVWDGTTFIYKDFAYESTPNKAIKAGDKGITSINDKNQDFGFSIYPNPTTNKITIFNKSKTLITKIKIYTVLGKNIDTHKIENSINITIDVSKLPRGIYFLQLISIEGVILNKRIIIE